MEYNDTKSVVQNFTCILPNEITDDQWNFSYSFSWWLDGFGTVLISFVGIVLNVTSIIVLWGSELAASFFNWLLVCLAIFDILFLMSCTLEAIRGYFTYVTIARYCDIDSGGNKALVMKQFLDDEKVLAIM